MHSITLNNHDLVTCPISLGIPRYPILASDGHTYELNAFIKYIEEKSKISPTTRQPITSVIYQNQLKATLDESSDASIQNNRNPDYTPDEYFKKLNQFFPATQHNPSHLNIISAGWTSFRSTLIYIVINTLLDATVTEAPNQRLNTSSFIFIFMIATFLSDLIIRQRGIHEDGLFGFFSSTTRWLTTPDSNAENQAFTSDSDSPYPERHTLFEV